MSDTIRSLESRFRRSRELGDSARLVIPGGVTSSVRAGAAPIPIFFERGKGSRLWDVDGNEYIDFLLAYGPSFLGHAPDGLADALSLQLRKGLTFGASHEGEQIAARKVSRVVPNAEKVIFSQTGSEAVSAALRIARTYTNRSIVLKFQGHYHGWLDGMFASVGNAISIDEGSVPVPQTSGVAPGSRDDVVVCPWNDLEHLRLLFSRLGGEIAAIIVEPVNVNGGVIPPTDGFLSDVRAIADQYGCLLIFDEVITGFRVALGGSQERFSVNADLVIFGKAIASGFPISAVTGRSEILDVITDGRLAHNGTFNGNPLGCTAIEYTMDYLFTNRLKTYARLDSLGLKLANGLRLLDERLTVRNVGPICFSVFGEPPDVRRIQDRKSTNADLQRRFAAGLVEKGIYTQGLWYLSTAHSEQDVDRALEVASEVLTRL
jgi:glutamate-1-semialdehyde 2,1-aminomutase